MATEACIFGQHYSYEAPCITWTKNCASRSFSKSVSWKPPCSRSTSHGFMGSSYSRMSFLRGSHIATGHKKEGKVQVLSSSSSQCLTTAVECLNAWDDEYGGVVIDPESLPLSANAFSSALKASLALWKSKEKKGIWLKLVQEQADLVPMAIQEGFNYHHAGTGYVMLTYWIPSTHCLLPESPSHQIGIAAFVINDKSQILAVKEKCPCSCSGVWKLPTGYINKSEEIFSGAVREVKEETGVDTIFIETVAFRHAHLVAFEKSDLQFVCMLKPLTSAITVDDKEIEDAKWITPEELLSQPFYKEDEMSTTIIQRCMATHEHRRHYYAGFVPHRSLSKFDGKLTYLYYNQHK